MLGCLVNCFSCDVLHVCQNMNNVSWVFSSSLPAALSYLSLFYLAAGRARSPWKGREDGSGGACAPRHAKQCPFALGSTHLHLGGGCFCHLDLLLFPLSFCSLSGKVRMEAAHGMKCLVRPFSGVCGPLVYECLELLCRERGEPAKGAGYYSRRWSCRAGRT